MNENIDLTEILKDCPKGTKLYSTIHGEVLFDDIISNNPDHPIKVTTKEGTLIFYSKTGLYNSYFEDAECVLFPANLQRDWSKFVANKFNPSTLQPFDKVLVRDIENPKNVWYADIVTCIRDIDAIPWTMSGLLLYHVIPFNDDTKHLCGTNNEAPEYYRYWED